MQLHFKQMHFCFKLFPPKHLKQMFWREQNICHFSFLFKHSSALYCKGSFFERYKQNQSNWSFTQTFNG